MPRESLARSLITILGFSETEEEAGAPCSRDEEGVPTSASDLLPAEARDLGPPLAALGFGDIMPIDDDEQTLMSWL